MPFTNPFLLLSIVCGVLYYVTQPWHPFPGVTVLKGLSVAPLALLVWTKLKGRDGVVLGLALAFGSLGDVLLDWSAGMFPFGLGAFLIGHFCYIAVFSRNREKKRPIAWTTWLVLLLLAVASGGISVYLVPATGSLAPAVVAYVSALVGMAATAVALQLAEPWVMIGGLLFVVSDSVLAVSKFMSPVPGRGWIVWSTYYLAQLLLAVGFLRFKGVKLDGK